MFNPRGASKMMGGHVKPKNKTYIANKGDTVAASASKPENQEEQKAPTEITGQ